MDNFRLFLRKRPSQANKSSLGLLDPFSFCDSPFQNSEALPSAFPSSHSRRTAFGTRCRPLHHVPAGERKVGRVRPLSRHIHAGHTRTTALREPLTSALLPHWSRKPKQELHPRPCPLLYGPQEGGDVFKTRDCNVPLLRVPKGIFAVHKAQVIPYF